MIDLNVVYLEGIVVRRPIKIGGREWGFRMSIDNREIRIRTQVDVGQLHVGHRVWIAGHVEDVMVMRVVAEDIKEIAEDPPGRPRQAA